MKYKFSLIIPVYNVEPFLKKCLDSVIGQLYKDFEVIIVCDKCDDGSEAIVDEYVKNDNRFKKIYAERTGLSKARNIGVDAVSGKYILFLDADDYLNVDCLKILNKALNDSPDIIRFQAQEDKNGEIIKYNEKSFETMSGVAAFEHIFRSHYIENAWLYCYNSKFYKKNNFVFMENCVAEDYGLIPLIIAKADKVKGLSYIGYNYVQRCNSLMSNTDYDKKIKKMNDMIKQAEFLKKQLVNIPNTELIITFINNSLIYYSTTLKYGDYKHYNSYLKQSNCFDHLKSNSMKQKLKNLFIKNNSYIFYNYLARK